MVDNPRPWTRMHAATLRLAYQDVFPDVSDERLAQDLIGVSTRVLYYWAKSADDSVVRRGSQKVLSEFFHHVPAEVKARYYDRLAQERESTLTLAAPGSFVDGRGGSSSDPGEDFALMAQEVTQDLVLDSASVTDGLEVLNHHMLAAARDYSDKSPLAEFAMLRRLRSSCRSLDTRTRRPQDRSELFAITGMITALMASTAFDLGHWTSARELATAATSYGNLAGHRSLEAWTLGLQATVAFWDNRPGQALSALERGLHLAPSPASRFRLHNIAARTHATVNDREGVTRCLDAAQREQHAMESAAREELHDGIGGEFAFDGPRATACAAAAWLRLCDGANAEGYALQTLRFYTDVPVHAIGQGPARGAQIDLASARIMQGNLDGTGEAMEPILSLPVDHRNISLAGRVANTRQLLKEANDRGGLARDMGDRLDQWLDSARKVQAAI